MFQDTIKNDIVEDPVLQKSLESDSTPISDQPDIEDENHDAADSNKEYVKESIPQDINETEDNENSEIKLNNGNGPPPFLNIIDGTGNFEASMDELKDFIKASGLEGHANRYTVISILGCQSTGKSTLLNKVFGTSFFEMDALKGRKQCTLGIWLDGAEKLPDCLVLDSEGTDSSERGEDRKSFEHQTGLFALSLSEILIINLWASDIGRYEASNIGILKTIFAVHLQLFRAETKTTLLFVIRDYVDDTPIGMLEEKLKVEIDKIWMEVKKPEGLENAKVSDVFQLEYHALAHMRLTPKLFNKGINELRARFTDKQAVRGALFRSKHHHSKSVPIDGFPKYISDIWSTIRSQKDLNIPSQREMLATFRCEEILSSVFLEFIDACKIFDVEKNGDGFIENFRSKSSKIISKHLDKYIGLTRGYEQKISQKKFEDLKLKECDYLKSYFLNNVDIIHKQTVKSFQESLLNSIPSDTTVAVSDFTGVVKKCVLQAEVYFNEHIQSSLPASHIEWSCLLKEAKKKLDIELNLIISSQRKEQLSVLFNEAVEFLKRKSQSKITAVFNRARSKMWSELQNVRIEVLEFVGDLVKEKLRGFEVTQEETNDFLNNLKTSSRTIIANLHQEYLQYLSMKMRKKFENLFKVDENSMPRVWDSTTDIRAIFRSARQESLTMIDLFRCFRLPYEDGETTDEAEEVEVLSTSDCEELTEKFNENIQSALLEAENIVKGQSNPWNVPWFFWLLLFWFGYDDILRLLFNPFLFMLTIFGLILGGSIYFLGLTGPVKLLFYQIFNSSKKAADSYLQEKGVNINKETIRNFRDKVVTKAATAAFTGATKLVTGKNTSEDNDNKQTNPVKKTKRKKEKKDQ